MRNFLLFCVGFFVVFVELEAEIFMGEKKTWSVRWAERSEIDWVNQRYDEVEFVHSVFEKEVIAVAEANDQTAGLGRLVTIDKYNLELGGIYVFEQFRGQGVAKQLVEFLLSQATPGQTIYCIPFTHLESFYKQYGFVSCSDLEKVPKELLDKYLWCKEKYPQSTTLLVKEAYHCDVLQGEGLRPICDELAELRITVFCEYPYLYDGSFRYERSSLEQYASSENSVAVVVKEGDRIIGAMTGIPMKETVPACRNCFEDRGISTEGIFYLKEMSLLKEYRGRGIGKKMYDVFEEFIKKTGKYHTIAFCEVVPQKDDPKQPGDYFCLDPFWVERGYEKHSDLVIQFSWKELGIKEKIVHPLIFWTKTLFQEQAKEFRALE